MPGSQKSHTPRRPCVPDWNGRPFSLSDEASAWEALPSINGQGKDILLLGLGPGRPWDLPFVADAVAAGGKVFWLDALGMVSHTSVGAAARIQGEASLSEAWQKTSPDEAVRLAQYCQVFFYRPGLRLVPDFWGPLLGRLYASCLVRGAAPAVRSTLMAGGIQAETGAVFLPGQHDQLLQQELLHALRELGFGPCLTTVPPLTKAEHLTVWRGLLERQRPALLLSVNMRGLDVEGRLFHVCRALGIPVAIWFVDNPWHLLSSLRLPWWREACLFVTDASFILPLRAAGARQVHFLPLAASPHMWRAMPDVEQAAVLRKNPPLFVGRSAFPGRERFFAATRIPEELWAVAQGQAALPLGDKKCPHFHWWQGELAVAGWPGQAVRQAGLGAENCSCRRRAAWLQIGLEAGLQIRGDSGWQQYLPVGTPVLPPVDYYGSLPDEYGTAGAVLNVTSLLLPQSLNQRHFDVWAAGGLLLTDDTPGLDVFPAELTKPIRLARPQDFARRLADLRADRDGTYALCRAWRQHLRQRHSYTHRLRQLLDILTDSYRLPFASGPVADR